MKIKQIIPDPIFADGRTLLREKPIRIYGSIKEEEKEHGIPE